MTDFDKIEADTDKVLKNASINLVVFIICTFFVAWLVMFSAAIMGFAIGYLPALLLTYTASCVIGLGTMGLKGSK